jgi:hypothetical protein
MTASGVMLNSGHVMHAHITYDGTNLTLVLTDTVTSQVFTKVAALNIPSIVGSGTAYVGFTAATGGLTMTTDILNWTLSAGSTAASNAAVMTATSAAAHYSDAPALAVGNGSTSGTVEPSKLNAAPVLASSLAPTAAEEAIADEVHVTGIAGEPRLFPDPGVFAADMEVTLQCDTPGATIHYTFDGSQPVATSPVYSAPIEVKGTELTIKAFASVPGKKDSAVVTGIYRIRE